MAAAFFLYLLFVLSAVTSPTSRLASAASVSDFSIVDEAALTELLRHDYSPPSPPPPPPPSYPPPLSCEELKGIGSVNTTCELNRSWNFTKDVYVYGVGNVFILPSVVLACPYLGCTITISITGEFKLSQGSVIIAGAVDVVAGNASLYSESLINTTALAGEPSESLGTPEEEQGGGGGFGGRGASCMIDNQNVWGGDVYGWDSLASPFIYGSRGGSTSKEEDYGGIGGGRVRFEVEGAMDASGVLLADGGDGGIKGGGGSGGSIYIKTKKM